MAGEEEAIRKLEDAVDIVSTICLDILSVQNATQVSGTLVPLFNAVMKWFRTMTFVNRMNNAKYSLAAC